MDWWEDNKRLWRGRNSSSYSLSPEARHSILQPMKVELFISKDQHISLLQAPTPFLSPIFSLCPLSIHLSLSYSLANGKTVLGCILFFKGIDSPLYTLDLTLWQALSVSSAWYTGLVFCVLMDTAHYHTQVQAHTLAHTQTKVHLLTCPCMQTGGCTQAWTHGRSANACRGYSNIFSMHLNTHVHMQLMCRE